MAPSNGHFHAICQRPVITTIGRPTLANNTLQSEHMSWHPERTTERAMQIKAAQAPQGFCPPPLPVPPDPRRVSAYTHFRQPLDIYSDSLSSPRQLWAPPLLSTQATPAAGQSPRVTRNPNKFFN